MNLLKDIYYNQEYSKLYIEENYSLFNYEYKEGDFVLRNLAIKKPIIKVGTKEVHDGFFDLETPYGYGGLYTNSKDKSFLDRAFDDYRQACLEQNIIAEFFSFHPFSSFPVENSDRLNVCFLDRDVVVVDLTKSDEERWEDYSSKNRTILRKCYKQLQVEETTEIDSFMELYYETMTKNNARSFYYFDRNYFEKLAAIEGIKLLKVSLNGEVIAMSFVMLGENVAHYHLSANKSAFLKYNANYILLEEAFKLAKTASCESFLLGGGRTNSPEDALFRFKRKFSKITKEFYLGGNIYNKEAYEVYCKMWKEQNPDNEIKYFLKYRL